MCVCVGGARVWVKVDKGGALDGLWLSVVLFVWLSLVLSCVLVTGKLF